MAFQQPVAGGITTIEQLEAGVNAAVSAEATARGAADTSLTQQIAAQATARQDGISNAGVLPLTNVAGINAITASIDPAIGPGVSITRLATIELVPAATNTGPVTLTIDGVGPGQVAKRAGGDVAPGDLKAGEHYILRRHGGGWRLIGVVSSEIVAAGAYALSGARPTGETIPPGATAIITRNGQIWKKDNTPGPEDETHAIDGGGQRWFKAAKSWADDIEADQRGLIKDTDSAGALVRWQDKAGGEFLPGLDHSVQEEFRRVRQRIEAISKGSGAAVGSEVDSWNINNTGESDASGAINAAIETLAQRPVPTALVLPPGRYRIENEIKCRSGVSVIGADRSSVVILPTGRTGTFRYNKATFGQAYLAGCTFANMTVDGIGQTDTSANVALKGFYFQGFIDCLFTDLIIKNTGATGLGIDFSSRSIIQRVLAINCGRIARQYNATAAGASGIGIGTGYLTDEPLIISDCICEGNWNYGIFVERQNATDTPYQSRGNIIRGNICRGNRHGIGESGCDGTIIEGNLLDGNVETGISLDKGTYGGGARPGPRAVIRGNVISRNGSHGIHYDAGSRDSLAGYVSTGNRIIGNGGAAHKVDSSTAMTVSGWRIDDECHDNGGSAIHLASGMGLSDIDISGQFYRNTGAGIQIDVPVTGGRVFGVSLRDLRTTGATQTASIAGAGALTDFDISEVVAAGASAVPMNLTGARTRVTFGRNVGI